jgi:type I restriction enzyme S subunit
MKTAELRHSILQSAVQGKLVPQNVDDEPASVLLKRISAEKAKLVKEGKLRKEKLLPSIAEDETPYDLPEGWIWCRLGDVATFKNGLSKRNSSIGTKKYVFRLADISAFAFTLKSVRRIRVTDDEIEQFSILKDDLAIIRVNGSKGNVGRAVLFEGIAEDCLICDHLMRMRFFIPQYKKYVRTLLNSNLLRTTIEGLIITTAGQHTVNQKNLSNVVIPLPPLAEQLRIVAKVDELMALCDEMEATEKELDELEIHFTKYLPQSILQAAVQGKLVPQNNHDESASELLKRIRQEKVQLVKEGKIKKEKPLPPITKGEMSYELPDRWVWCRLGDICNIIMGQSPDGNSVSEEQGIEFHQGKSFFSEMYLKESLKKTNMPTKIVENGDILLAVRAPVGAVNITPRQICIGRGLCALQRLAGISSKFVFYFLRTMEKYFKEQATGTTFIAISAEIVKNTPFPLPPLSEQQHIVAKVDELMALCDELKNARHLFIKPATSNSVPFQPKEDIDDELLIAARGDASQGLSDKAQSDVDELWGD